MNKPSEGRQDDKRQFHLLHDIGIRIVKITNLVLVAIPFAICLVEYYLDQSQSGISYGQYTGIILMFMALYFFFGRVYDAFFISLKRISEMFYSQMLSILMADGFMFFVLVLLKRGIPSILPPVLALFGQCAVSVLWCLLAHRWYFSHFAKKKTGIVYDVRRDVEGLFGKYGLDRKFDVQFICNVEECLSRDMGMLEGIDAVFLCGVHSRDRNIILKRCVSDDIVCYVIPRVGDVLMSGARKMHMFHLPILRAERYNPPIEFKIAKRLFDILSSALAIILLSPVLLAVAIAIKACDGGPVLYKQARLTQNGKQFMVWKFRSMRVDAEKDGVAKLSSGASDDRVTPVGKVIRACRLDELPQLFNIFGGSMSVVGPRPERPEIAAQYEKEIPEFSLRLQAKAGLTGYAQVYGKYNTQPYDKLQMDLMYIAKPSIAEDIRIIFATIKILFVPESTEGIATGGVTAMDSEDEEERIVNCEEAR